MQQPTPRCPCCSKGVLRPITEVGHTSKDRCNLCGAIVPRRGEIPQRCPKCGQPYYDVEDHGDVSFFVHMRVDNQNVGCTVPTQCLTGFQTAAERLGRRVA